MSKVNRIQFQITIDAPPQVVWDVMLGAETYPRWTASFAEGSYFEGSWSQGSRIKFLTPPGDGMVAEIAESRPHQFLSIRHLGFVSKGVEDTQSEAVQKWAPAYENYTLMPTDSGTRILVEQDVASEFEEFMQTTWPKALGVLKQLCEDRSVQ